MTTHDLKTDPDVFDAVQRGDKTFEIRFNDRNFRVGDTLHLLKTVHTGAQMKAGAPLVYTCDEIVKTVSHVLTGYGLAEGWCCLSFAPELQAPEGGPDVRTAAQRALDAMDVLNIYCINRGFHNESASDARLQPAIKAAEALRAALAAQPVMLNGLTEAETNETASVKGLIGQPSPAEGDGKPAAWRYRTLGENDWTLTQIDPTGIGEVVEALYPQRPIAAGADDAKDAARFRWLIDERNWNENEDTPSVCTSEDVHWGDKARALIDRHMKG